MSTGGVNKRRMSDYHFDVDDPDWCEFWVDVAERPAYEVSSLGRVANKETGLVLKQSTDGNGYKRIGLKGGVTKNFSVHRLVLLNFLANPMNKPQVNHIDGVKANNRLSNLEWATQAENIRHAFIMGLSTNDSCKKHVVRISPSGERVTFESISQAASETENCRQGNVSNVANGRRKTHGGYRWEFA
jgi:hypothetical protein